MADEAPKDLNISLTELHSAVTALSDKLDKIGSGGPQPFCQPCYHHPTQLCAPCIQQCVLCTTNCTPCTTQCARCVCCTPCAQCQ
jgi:hypothetical protein